MKSTLSNTASSTERHSPYVTSRFAPLLFAAGAALLGGAVLLYGLVAPHAVNRRCLLVVETGLPCPLCGGTRALSALAHGDIPDALHWHAFAAVFVPLLFLSGIAALILTKHRQKIVSRLYLFTGLAGWMWLGYYILRVFAVLIGGTKWAT